VWAFAWLELRIIQLSLTLSGPIAPLVSFPIAQALAGRNTLITQLSVTAIALLI